MFRIGLAGGMGSGKSEVAARLSELGALVIEADAVARDIVAVGTKVFAARKRWLRCFPSRGLRL